jgi:cytochrome c-type biogenesis protein CcsB
MEIKYTTQGLLIYATMGLYLVAFVARLARRRKLGDVLCLAGFAAGLCAFGYRWWHVRHVPLQNLFEVFLCLGVVCYPVSALCRRYLRVGGYAADMLIGAIVLFPAGFVFSAEPRQLPPALQCWVFAPHVAVYVLAYIFMAKATYQAICQLARLPSAVRHPPSGVLWTAEGGLAGCEAEARPPAVGRAGLLSSEEGTYRMVCVGFPLLTLGLILGSYWGKLAWGDYWGWDPKEMWSLASWLVYVGYLHFRYMFGRRHARINSIWAIVGMCVIVITMLWVNLSRLFAGLHSYAT